MPFPSSSSSTRRRTFSFGRRRKREVPTSDPMPIPVLVYSPPAPPLPGPERPHRPPPAPPLKLCVPEGPPYPPILPLFHGSSPKVVPSKQPRSKAKSKSLPVHPTPPGGGPSQRSTTIITSIAPPPRSYSIPVVGSQLADLDQLLKGPPYPPDFQNRVDRAPKVRRSDPPRPPVTGPSPQPHSTSFPPEQPRPPRRERVPSSRAVNSGEVQYFTVRVPKQPQAAAQGHSRQQAQGGSSARSSTHLLLVPDIRPVEPPRVDYERAQLRQQSLEDLHTTESVASTTGASAGSQLKLPDEWPLPIVLSEKQAAALLRNNNSSSSGFVFQGESAATLTRQQRIERERRRAARRAARPPAFNYRTNERLSAPTHSSRASSSSNAQDRHQQEVKQQPPVIRCTCRGSPSTSQASAVAQASDCGPSVVENLIYNLRGGHHRLSQLSFPSVNWPESTLASQKSDDTIRPRKKQSPEANKSQSSATFTTFGFDAAALELVGPSTEEPLPTEEESRAKRALELVESARAKALERQKQAKNATWQQIDSPEAREYLEKLHRQLKMPPKTTKASPTKPKSDVKANNNKSSPARANGSKALDKTASRSNDGHGNETEESDVEGFEDAEGGDESPQHTRNGLQGVDDDDDQQTDGYTLEAVDSTIEAEQQSAEVTSEEIADQAANPGSADASLPTDPEAVPAPATPKASHAAPSVPKIETANTGTAAVPPPPPPRPSMSADSPLKASQSSLWDRLKSPSDKSTAKQPGSTVPTSPTTQLPPSSAAPRRGSYAPSLMNTLTSAANYAATSAASRGFQLPERLGGGQAAAASLSSTIPGGERRLPRHDVDDEKMMEDQMRFAEARHVLATSQSLEEVRSLGKELEDGWREKLAEVTELHVKFEDLTNNVSDIKDENQHLRLQMATLSEEIARREEDLEGFQRLTSAWQEKEKILWEQEVREERERLEWKEREAVRILAEERAINAQLRLVLLGSMHGQEGGLAGALAASSGGSGHQQGLLSKMQRASMSSNSTQSTSRRSAVFDSYDSEPSSQSGGVDSPPLERHGMDNSSGGGEDGSIQDDVLFNLNLPHTSSSNGGAISPPSTGHTTASSSTAPTSAGIYSALLSDVVPLDQLKLLLKFNPEEDTDAIRSVLGDVSSQYTTQAQQGSDSDSTTGGGGTTLEQHLLTLKGLSDYQLSQALQLENSSLRIRLRDDEKDKKDLEDECRLLKDKLRGMEEAIGGLLEGGGNGHGKSNGSAS